MSKSPYKRLSLDDLGSRWMPVFQRIFIENVTGYYTLPFRDSSWELAPIPYDPTNLGSPVHWSDYEQEEYSYYEFQPLLDALVERGTNLVCIMDTMGDNHFEIKPSVTALKAAMKDPDFPPIRIQSYFSAEADWGLQTFWEEVSLLGGTPEFMESFYRHAGGREAVRQRFIDYDVGCAWALAHYPRSDLPCEPDEYPYNDGPREDFYNMIGWEMPAYDMEQIKRDAPWLFKKPGKSDE